MTMLRSQLELARIIGRVTVGAIVDRLGLTAPALDPGEVPASAGC
jgi:hypothetical protein